MSSQKYVILTHSNAMGGGVRINDIQVDDNDVIFTAEHGGKLTLSLRKCVHSLMVSSMGDSVMLNYVQAPCSPAMVAPSPQRRPGGYGMVMGGLFGTDFETMVENNVVALFEHELTTRLIEPLRATVRDMVVPQPQAAPYRGYAATACDNSTVVLTMNGDRVTWIDPAYPTAKVTTESQTYSVPITRLSVVTGPTPNIFNIVVLDRDTVTAPHVSLVSEVLARYLPEVGREYLRYMNIAEGDFGWNENKLYLRDTAGEIGEITDVSFTDGLFTFSVLSGKQVQVEATHIDRFAECNHNPATPVNTFGVLRSPITYESIVVGVFNLLATAFPNQAEQYKAFMKDKIAKK